MAATNEEINPTNQDTSIIDDEVYEIKRFVVDGGQSPLRIDKFVTQKIEHATRNKVQQALEQGLILVNGKPVKSNYKTKPFDEIVIFSDDEEEDSSEVLPQPIPLHIVYEDDYLMIINKPAGLVVHPGSGNKDGTLINGVAYHIKNSITNNEELLPRSGLVHRIDKNTSGLMVVAKTEMALQHLSKQFFYHTIQRKYLALVWGDVENDSGTIVAHVGRSKNNRKVFEAFPDGEYGKHAITHYKVLERMGYVTLVECILETGRTHQIRVHMKYIGHPLFADDFYGGDKIVKGTVYTKYKQFVQNCFNICNRQALHAQILGLEHPATQEKLHFEMEAPEDLKAVIEKWRNYKQVKGVIE
jgi:23S rRNA pseudouridine1911/1915/1917 synthase